MTRSLLALAFALTLLAGCGGDDEGSDAGGGDGATKEQFVAEANRICREGEEKLSGITGAKLLFLKVAPATPVAKAAGPASKRNAQENETLDLPDADGPALKSAGRSPDGSGPPAE